MQININISDELLHRTETLSTASFSMDSGVQTLYAASGANSGGTAPASLEGSGSDLGRSAPSVLSAGPAEQRLEPVEPSAGQQVNNNGGSAPR